MKLNYSLLWLFLLIICCLASFYLGLYVGTTNTIELIGKSLSGSTININFNETKLVEETMIQFNKTILPQLNSGEKLTQ